MDTKSKISIVANAILNTFQNEAAVVYGMDTEFCEGERFARTLQTSLPRLNGKDFKVKIFDFNAAGIHTSSDLPAQLRRMLMSKKFIPTERLVGGDCKKLLPYGVHIVRWIELRGMSLAAAPNLTGTSIKDLAEIFLCGTIDKHRQTVDYTQKPLPRNLQEYAALDALVS